MFQLGDIVKVKQNFDPQTNMDLYWEMTLNDPVMEGFYSKHNVEDFHLIVVGHDESDNTFEVEFLDSENNLYKDPEYHWGITQWFQPEDLILLQKSSFPFNFGESVYIAGRETTVIGIAVNDWPDLRVIVDIEGGFPISKVEKISDETFNNLDLEEVLNDVS